MVTKEQREKIRERHIKDINALLNYTDKLEKMYASKNLIYDGMVEETFKQVGDYQSRTEKAESERDRYKSRTEEYAAALMDAKKKIATLERALVKYSNCETCNYYAGEVCTIHKGGDCICNSYRNWQFDEARFMKGASK